MWVLYFIAGSFENAIHSYNDFQDIDNDLQVLDDNNDLDDNDDHSSWSNDSSLRDFTTDYYPGLYRWERRLDGIDGFDEAYFIKSGFMPVVLLWGIIWTISGIRRRKVNQNEPLPKEKL